MLGSKFLFSPPNSDIFNSPSTSSLAGRAGAREFRQLKKRRAETARTPRSRSKSSSRSRSRSRNRSTMDGRLSRIGGREFGESDVSDSEFGRVRIHERLFIYPFITVYVMRSENNKHCKLHIFRVGLVIIRMPILLCMRTWVPTHRRIITVAHRHHSSQ